MKGFASCPACHGTGQTLRALPQYPTLPPERVGCDMLPLPHEVGGEPVIRAIMALRGRGQAVEPASDLPGLFRINGGPEITRGQLLSIAFTA